MRCFRQFTLRQSLVALCVAAVFCFGLRQFQLMSRADAARLELESVGATIRTQHAFSPLTESRLYSIMGTRGESAVELAIPFDSPGDVIDDYRTQPASMQMICLSTGKLQSLEVLDLTGLPLTDEHMYSLARLDQLRKVCLNGTGITDASAEVFALWNQLETLELYDTSLSSDAAKFLSAKLGCDVYIKRRKDELRQPPSCIAKSLEIER